MTQLRKEQYKSLLVISVGFALIGWRFHQWYLIAAASLTLLVGVSSVYILVKITDTWMWIGEKIGAVMSRVILSIIFIFFLTPISILYRSFGRKNRKEKEETYFKERNHTYTAADLEKIF